MLSLQLPAPDAGEPLALGGRERLATATDVGFLDDTTLVAASLLGRALHVIDVEDGRLHLRRSVPTAHPIDLFDQHDGRLVTANCPLGDESGSLSVFSGGAELRHERTYELPGLRTHGCLWWDATTVLGTSTRPAVCFLLDLSTGQYRLLRGLTRWAPKSCTRWGDHVVVVSSQALPGSPPSTPRRSAVTLFDASWRAIDEREFEGICDDVAVAEDRLLITIQNLDHLRCFDRRRGGLLLRTVGVLPGFSFPHGVAARGGRRPQVAVASYDNTVQLWPLDQLLAWRLVTE